MPLQKALLSVPLPICWGIGMFTVYTHANRRLHTSGPAVKENKPEIKQTNKKPSLITSPLDSEL